MAVVIRLKRTGHRNRPCYRISVADSRWPRDGRTLETLGLYDPIAPKAENQHTLKVDRARHWLALGARPSETVHALFKRHDVYEGDLDLDKTNQAHRKRAARPGRKNATKTRARKQENKKARAEAKAGRRDARMVARREAAKAAKAAEGESEE